MKSQPKVTNTSEVQWTDLKTISPHPACPSCLIIPLRLCNAQSGIASLFGVRCIYFFRAESLSLYAALFHVPGTSGNIREALHYIMLFAVSHATHSTKDVKYKVDPNYPLCSD